jgi:hypothetical protein
MNMKKPLILLCLASFLIVGVVVAQQVIQINIRSSAVIRSMFDAYWDLDCTRIINNIDWGLLEPASSQTVTIYIRNTSPSSAILNLTSRNWTPQGSDSYITLSWDREGFTLKPNQTVEVRLTLTVNANIRDITEFSFEIIINAIT